MAKQFDDSFDRYEAGRVDLVGLIGVWADVQVSTAIFTPSIVVPSFGARTGTKCLEFRPTGTSSNRGLRAVLRLTAANTIFIAGGFYLDGLPGNNTRVSITLRDAANAQIGEITFGSTGTIIIRDAAGNEIGVSSAPVISANAWTFLEIKVVMSTSVGEFQVRDAAGNVLANVSGLNIGTGPIAGISFRNINNIDDGYRWYLDDFSVKDSTGSFMNGFYPTGGVRNFLVRPNADVTPVNWEFIARRMFDVGVGQILDDQTAGFHVPDAAALRPGTGDFTFEGTFRWNALPGTGEIQYLGAKWREGNNHRSWRLFLYENGGNYYLSFEYSTDGTTGTLVTVHDFPFEPDVYRPYTIAVCRASGVNRLFIDGVRVGPAVADTANYYSHNSPMAIGAHMTSGSAVDDAFNGWLDEIRYTVGVGRYTADYTPATVKFPRTVGGDPDFASVQLLMGFDTLTAIDESSAGRTVTTDAPAQTLITDDGLFAYQSIDKIGRDDTFIEAAYLPATGTFELTGLPSAAETVVIGSDTYTFVAALAAAYDVLIGVDAEETIDNLIAAVNQDAGAGVIYGTGTVANADADATALPGAITKITAILPGTAGNSIVFTTTVTNSTISGSGTLAGGTDIPSPSTYFIERLPRGTTRVDSISLFTRRSVYGPGGATMTPSFVDGSNASSNGTTAAAPANPAWQVDQFDANGGIAWSVANFVGSRVRVTRNT